MIDPELKARLDTIEEKVDAAYKAAHRAQQYLFWTGVVTVAFIVIPLIGLAFAIPYFLNNTVGTYNSLLNNQPLTQQQQSQGAQTTQLLNSLGL